MSLPSGRGRSTAAGSGCASDTGNLPGSVGPHSVEAALSLQPGSRASRARAGPPRTMLAPSGPSRPAPPYDLGRGPPRPARRSRPLAAMRVRVWAVVVVALLAGGAALALVLSGSHASSDRAPRAARAPVRVSFTNWRGGSDP